MALTLYHSLMSRSGTVRWMLEEIGAPYELKLLKPGESRAPAYLAINPMGKVPAIDHDGVIVTETAAILTYLGDAFPAAGLAPAIGDARRGPYLKWLFFCPGVLEPAAMDRAFPRKEEAPRSAAGYGDFDTAYDTLAAALRAGPYLTGDTFTAADLLTAALLRYFMYVKAVAPRPEFTAFVERCSGRPAAQRAAEKDQALMAAQG